MDPTGHQLRVALSSGLGFLVLALAAGAMFVVLPNLISFDEVAD